MPRAGRLDPQILPRASGLAALLPLLVLCLGCGYRSLLAPDPSSPEGEGGRMRLAVESIRNDSPEPWLDRIVTEAIRREMAARGRIELVDNPEAADLVLRGRVRPLDIRSQSFSSYVAALEYALTLELDCEVLRRQGDIVRLDSEMLSETDVYLASADVEVTRRNRLELLRRLSDLLAGRLADSLELMEEPLAAEAGEERR
ncbi:MAG: hypothetical protein JRG86_07470 [Deltaproteobacteria bacterium]|jgi:hypothetical protein|nr:hypothetical protein [Deltaproteobacteria bacterium]